MVLATFNSLCWVHHTADVHKHNEHCKLSIPFVGFTIRVRVETKRMLDFQFPLLGSISSLQLYPEVGCQTFQFPLLGSVNAHVFIHLEMVKLSIPFVGFCTLLKLSPMLISLSIPFVGFILRLQPHFKSCCPSFNSLCWVLSIGKYNILCFPFFQFPLLGSDKTVTYYYAYGGNFQFPLLGSTHVSYCLMFYAELLSIPFVGFIGRSC